MPPICWKEGQTSDIYRNYWAIPVAKLLKFIPMSVKTMFGTSEVLWTDPYFLLNRIFCRKVVALPCIYGIIFYGQTALILIPLISIKVHKIVYRKYGAVAIGIYGCV